MAKATKTAGRIGKIKIRMYRGGTGDFFLLQFLKGNSSTPVFNMMIDCGCIHGGKAHFEPRVTDLATVTGHTIDLLVITHEHADHINGFEKMSAQFKDIKVKRVWFSWTESKEDDLANELRLNHSELDKALKMAVQRLQGLDDNGYYETLYANEANKDEMVKGRKKFIASLVGLSHLNAANGVALDGKPKPTMEDLMRSYKVIDDNTIVDFLLPGTLQEKLPGAEGIRFMVLGPPKDLAALSRTEKSGESYEKREEKSKVDFAWVSALSPATKGTNASLPFESEFEGSNPDIAQRYAADDWRKIDHDWLYSAGSLALRFELSINNTSLALAIQFEDSERVLLFPGDAEFGNWESWHKGLAWPIKINGKVEQKDAAYILGKTVFYKVGHHLSQNGTAKGKGIDLMNSGELTAMATLDFDKINSGWLNTMPNDLLGAELIRKTEGKMLFCGDWKTILDNIRTDRVIIKKSHEKAMEKLNSPFDGKIFSEVTITG